MASAASSPPSMKLYGSGDENWKALEDLEKFKGLSEQGKSDFFKPLYCQPADLKQVSQFSEGLLKNWSPYLKLWKETNPTSQFFLNIRDSFVYRSLECRISLGAKDSKRPLSELFAKTESEEGKLANRLLAFEKEIKSKPPADKDKPPVIQKEEGKK